MSSRFSELYSGLTKDVFLEQARLQVEQGANSLTSASTYAEQGKPDFALAYLLLSDLPDDVKSTILARAYERRAVLSEKKAEDFQQNFHRSFPLIKLEAQKDRIIAQQVRQGRQIQRDKSPSE